MDKTKMLEKNKNKNIIELLKLKSLTTLLYKTDQGELSISLRKGENSHYYTLDSVELDKETAKKLDNILQA